MTDTESDKDSSPEAPEVPRSPSSPVSDPSVLDFSPSSLNEMWSPRSDCSWLNGNPSPFNFPSLPPHKPDPPVIDLTPPSPISPLEDFTPPSPSEPNGGDVICTGYHTCVPEETVINISSSSESEWDDFAEDDLGPPDDKPET